MKAKDLDKIFDNGEIDIQDFADLSKAFTTVPNLVIQIRKPDLEWFST